MDKFISLYQERLHLQNATFLRIDHDDAMVAIVYKVAQSGKELILKICAHPRHYLREVYFLKHFAGKLPVPDIVQVVEPETGVHGAILMQCLPGALLKATDFTDAIAHEMGSLLARIHLSQTPGYGDFAEPQGLSPDPRIHFTSKFEEGLVECSTHLPQALLQKCRNYFDAHIDLLSSADGPCIVHRDFRPGNVIICDGKLQGIIDWASGRAGFAQEDFCPMEHGEWPARPASKKHFLEGYASIRPIPDYSQMMPLLRLSKTIATIGFTVKRSTWENRHARIYQFNRQFLESLFI